jgi:hypothetical protein
MKTTMLFAVVAASVICASASVSFPELKIRGDHPRMFFNRDTWPAIKERALKEGSPENAALKALLAKADAAPSNPVCRNTEALSTPKSQPIPETVE